MCYGIDSGSPRTLAFIGKQIDERILYQRVRETTEEGMVPTLSFVIGFPEEEIRDIDETLMLALRTGVQGNSNPLMQMPTVLPGTRLFERYSPLLVREVDTYFSLGIEFDAGNRITEDESLITHYPDIFSSFYNLPCTALPTTALHKIVSFFPMLVNFYPKSFMLLSFALKRSLSDLFFNWLAYVNGKESRNPVHLTSADCYRHFSVFATHIFDPEKGDPWDHVPQMVLYETSAIEAAGHNRSQSKTRPLIPEGQNDTLDLAEHTVIKSFTKNLSVIVADLKAGIFTEEYPDMRGYLVFHHKKNELNVMEINDFGADFLMLCDGHRTLEVIAELLNARYADGQGEDVFLEDCRATAEELTRFGLIKPSSDAR